MAKSDAYSPGLETYQNHLGYTLGYQLHLPKKLSADDKPPPVLVYFAGYGGSMTSKYITCSMEDVLESGVAVVCFDATPVERDDDFNTLSVDTSMLTPSYYVKTVHEALKHTVKAHGPEGDNLIDIDNIGINAASYGARGALHYAAHMNGLQKRVLDEPCVPIKGIVAQAPFLSLNPFRVAIFLGERKWKKNKMINVPIAGYMQDVPYGVIEELRAVDMYKDIAPHVTCPVKIIYGTDDPLSGGKNVELLQKCLTQVGADYKERHKIENVGHFFENKAQIEALKKYKEDDLRKMVKSGQENDKKPNLIARYIEENFRAITCLDKVIDVTRDFLTHKVFTADNHPDGHGHDPHHPGLIAA